MSGSCNVIEQMKYNGALWLVKYLLPILQRNEVADMFVL